MLEQNLAAGSSLSEVIASVHALISAAQGMVEEIWRFDAGGKINSLCSMNTGLLVGSEDKNVYCIDIEGNEQWRYETKGWVNALLYSDLDRNGVAEVVACSEDKHIYVLSEKGELRWSYECDAALRAASLGDLDGDGELEIVAGALGGSIYVLSPYGELKSELNISHDIHMANDVCSLCVADVTGDGKAEIIAGAFDTDVHVLRWEGGYVWRYETGHWVLSIESSDVDGDGHNEVIVGSEDRHVYVLDHNGKPKWQFEVQDRVMEVLAADLDQDGQSELVVASEDHGVYVLSHSGGLIWRHDVGDMARSVSFLPEAEKGPILVVGLDDGQVVAYRVRHIQGILAALEDACASFRDGRDLEAGLTDEERDCLKWVLSRGLERVQENIPSFETAWQAYRRGDFAQALSVYLQLAWRRVALKWSYQTDNWVRSVYACDVDGDGKNEVVVGSEDKCIYLLGQDGKLRWKYQAGDKIFQIYAVDIDNDGRIEILAGSEDRGIYVLDSGGLLRARYEMPDFVRSIYACDIDGDGAVEIVAGCFDNCVYVLDSQGREKWHYRTKDKVRAVRTEDIDGDGQIEVMAGSGDRNLYVLDSHGALKWQYETDHWVRSICPSDVNLDGEREVLIGADDRYLHVLDGRGNLLWRFRTSNWVASLFCLDIDADGNPEILIGSYDRYMYVLGKGCLKWKHDMGDRIKTIYALDLDEDGSAEILVGCDDGMVYVYDLVSLRDINAYVGASWESLVSSVGSVTEAVEVLLQGDEYLRGYAIHKSFDLLAQSPEMLRLAVGRIWQDDSTYVRCQFAQLIPSIFPKAPDKSCELIRILIAAGQQEVLLDLVDRLSQMVSTSYAGKVFHSLLLLATVDDMWVRRDLARKLADVVISYPEHTLPILFQLACDEEEWVQHETAVSLSRYLNRVTDANLIFETIEILLRKHCQISVLGYISTLSRERPVRVCFSLFYDLVSPRLIEDLASIEPIFWAYFDRQDVLGSDIVRILRSLHQIAETAREIDQTDNLQGKVQYIIQAAAAIEEIGRDIYSLGESASAFLHVLSRWRTVLSTALSNLQQRSDLRVTTSTQRVLYASVVTLVFDLENKGRGLARNICARLVLSDEYRVLKQPEKIPVIYAGQQRQLDFVVEPVKLGQMRVELEVEYDDLVEGGRKRLFADRIRFIDRPEKEFVTLEPNPYITGRPLRTKDAPMFAGREDVFEYLRANLLGKYRDNIVVLHGQRRTGKTSVLYQMGRILGDSYVPVLIDVQGFLDPGISVFLYTLASRIHDEVTSRGFDMRLPDLADFEDQPGIVFRRRFLPQALMAIDVRTLVLMFDEFELLEELVQQGKLDQGIFHYLRNLMQHSDRLDFLFAGTHKLEELSSDYWSILFNMAIYKRISFLDTEDARNLITMPVSEYFEIDDLAVDRIIWTSAGHPHFTQLICQQLVTHRNHRRLDYITVGDVNVVVDRVVETGGIHIDYLWRESTVQEKLCLAALGETLRRQGRATILDLQVALSRYGQKMNLSQVIENLVARDLVVEQDNGSCVFRIGLVEKWIERYKSIQQTLREVTA